MSRAASLTARSTSACQLHVASGVSRPKLQYPYALLPRRTDAPSACKARTALPGTCSASLKLVTRRLGGSSLAVGSVNRRSFISRAVNAFTRPESLNDQGRPLKSLPRTVENLADDPKLANPLQRHQRLSTGWMGVILEYEGIVLQSTWAAHQHAWLSVAEEEGKAPPLQWVLKRAEGMKSEQVIQEVFHWSRNPVEVRRIAQRKEEIFQELTADQELVVMPGVVNLLETCLKNNVPVALASSDPEARVLAGLEATGLKQYFSAIVTAGDCQYSRPDPEPYLYAAQLIGRPPVRCVVVGGSNASIEGSHDAGMQSVIVANNTPMFELTSGDLVVKDLTEISFVNLKQLFQLEQLTSWTGIGDEGLELEPEVEEERFMPYSSVITIDSDFF